MATVPTLSNGVEDVLSQENIGARTKQVKPNPNSTQNNVQTNGWHSESQAKDELHRDSSSKYPRISRPMELLRLEYDVVVIGSGYGGGVAASRMARGGQSVCLLERGKERWPGEYPASLKEAVPQLHVSGQLHPDNYPSVEVDSGDPTGLYHLVVGQGQNAFVANGLGGTSLLNANIFLRTDDGTQQMKAWPEELRGREKLGKYYERAEYMLQPQAYPKDSPQLPKLELLEKQREALGFGRFYRPPQTTRFEDGPNNVGVDMQASTLSGMDSTGINDGSKSSTLVNYLSDAWNWGAELFCECEVRYIRKRGEGYNIFFAWHGAKRNAFKQNLYEDLMFVHAKKLVFLGAGTLGTTEILLRSQQEGLPVSSNLGTGMSGNGDILAFGYNTNEYANSMGREYPSPKRPIGPTITGIIDCRDQDNPLDGFVIEEGAVPAALGPFYQFMLEHLPGRISPRDNDVVQHIHRALASIGSRVFGPYFPDGSIERTQVYLIMSHDSNQAIMTLKNDRPVLTFMGVGRSQHVRYLNQVLADATNAVGGTFVNSPFYAALNLEQEITVHPIGGAYISNDNTGSGGVTTHAGEVFTGDDKEVHEGLVVVDGALVPTALGVNPFATITALAERAVEHAAEKRGIQIDFQTKNGLLDLYGAPSYPYKYPKDPIKDAERTIQNAKSTKAPGIEFTEVMAGFIHLGNNIQEYSTSTKAARAACENARFFLSVRSWELDQLISSDNHNAMLTGTFTHGSLPASPYMVLRGTFRLFNEDSRTPNTANLTYDFDMVGTDGSKLHFHGYKLVNPSCAGSVLETWRATSTLFVTLTDPITDEVAGRGTLQIDPLQFGSELQTFTPYGSTTISRLFATSRFLAYFAKSVAGKFLGPLGPLQWPTQTNYHVFYQKAPPTATFQVTATDNVQSNMFYWEPAPGITQKSTNVLLVPGAAVSHEVFALPTMKQNSVEYFTSKGYRVFCVVTRIGKTQAAHGNWTGYDARKDVYAALEGIRNRQTPTDKKIYAVVHCVGAVAMASGLLDGTIPARWLKGITASNLFFNPVLPTVNGIKARAPIPIPNVYNLAAGSWFSCCSSKDDTLVQQLINQALRFYPVSSKAELCNSVVCHRTQLCFGTLWNHANLSAATHTHLEQIFGGTSMRAMTYLIQAGLAGALLTNPSAHARWLGLAWPTPGDPLVTPRNLARLRGVPILLFSGADNVTWSPESTSVSYSTLRDLFGPDDYERVVFQGRGHLDCWMSDRSALDVFPRVWRHMERVCADVEPPQWVGKPAVGAKAVDAKG